MKKLLLSAWAIICISGITIAQQDSTKTNQNKTQKEQKDKSNKTKDTNKKSSKKNKRDKVDSVNSNMDTTSKIETR